MMHRLDTRHTARDSLPHAHQPPPMSARALRGRYLLVAIFAAIPLCPVTDAAAQAPYRNASLPIETCVRDLLGRMTMEEKFWQLFMLPGSRADSTHDYSRGVFGLQDRRAADARGDAASYNALQRYFVDSARLGIPMLAFE